MSRGGAPASRARRIVADRRGIIICPRVEDFRPSVGEAPIGRVETGEEREGVCEVCGHAIIVSPATEPYEAGGWSLICTYDAERFREDLGTYVTSPELEADRAELIERFATEHGARPDEIVQLLPVELSWLAERGVA